MFGVCTWSEVSTKKQPNKWRKCIVFEQFLFNVIICFIFWQLSTVWNNSICLWSFDKSLKIENIGKSDSVILMHFVSGILSQIF